MAVLLILNAYPFIHATIMNIESGGLRIVLKSIKHI